MAKTKLSLMILGSIIIFMLGVLITYFLLLATGQVNGEANEITITIVDNEKEYDGTILNAEECEVTKGTLLKGHKIEAEYYGGITDVGVGESNCNIKIVDDSGKDYTKDYSITLKKGNLEVTKRPITLAIKKSGTNYDAESIIETNYDNDITDEIDYEVVSNIKLCKGHRLVPDFEVGVIQNVETLDGEDSYGETNVNMVAAIYDINGFDVTSNYAISYKDDMKVKINKPTLALTTLSYTKEYDGEPFDEDEILYNLKGELPKNYSIDVKYVNNINDIVNVDDSGLLVVDTRNTKITDEKGNDVTSNYKILAQNVGSLNITPVKLQLHADDYTAEYDGEIHKSDKFNIISDEKIEALDASTGTTGFILNGYEYKIDVLSSTEMTDVGSKTNNISFKIKLENSTSDENLVSNFTLVYDSSPVISVTRANLTIIADELKVEYKKDYDYGDYIKQYAELTGVLNNNQDLENAGFNIDSYIPVVPTIDEGGKYNVVLSNISITKGSSIVTSNFNIYTVYLTLNVDKFIIYAISNNYNGEYSGVAQSSSNADFTFTDSNGNLIDDEYDIEITDKGTITEINESGKPNSFKITVFKDGDEITDDITINYSFGNMYLTKKEFIVRTNNFNEEYNGSAQSADISDFIITNGDGSPVDTEVYTITFENLSDITEVSESGKTNTAEVVIKKGGNDVTNLCDITYIYGTMTLKKKKIVATSQNYNGTYDGTAQSSPNADFSIDSSGFDIEVIDKTEITNVSESGKKNKFTITISKDNTDVTDNIIISYNYGTMSLSKINVTVNSEDYSSTYDGTAQSAPDSAFTASSLDSKFTLSISNKATIKNVSESNKSNTFTADILLDGIIVTSNFTISYNPGKMTLAKKTVSLVTSDITVPYNYSGNVASYVKSQMIFDINIDLSEITFGTLPGPNTINTSNSNYSINGSYNVIYETLIIFDKTVFDYAASGNYTINYTCTNANNQYIALSANLGNITVGTYDFSSFYSYSGVGYTVLFNQSLVINKCTLYVNWKNKTATADYELGSEDDCEVKDSSGDNFINYDIDSGQIITMPSSPFGTAVSYSGVITIPTPDADCYNIVYIPGVITFS